MLGGGWGSGGGGGGGSERQTDQQTDRQRHRAKKIETETERPTDQPTDKTKRHCYIRYVAGFMLVYWSQTMISPHNNDHRIVLYYNTQLQPRKNTYQKSR